MAPICHVVACRPDSWVRNLVLRLTVWVKLVRGATLLIVAILPIAQLLRKYMETHDKEIIKELYKLAPEPQKLAKES